MSGKWLWGEAAILGNLRVALMARDAFGPETGQIHVVPCFAVLLPLLVGILAELHDARARTRFALQAVNRDGDAAQGHDYSDSGRNRNMFWRRILICRSASSASPWAVFIRIPASHRSTRGCGTDP